MYNNYYHGTGNLDSIKENGFLLSLTGQGNNGQGVGFYFTNTKSEADKRYTKANINELNGKIGGESSPGTVKVNLNIKNPIMLPEDATHIQDAEIEITPDQAFAILQTSSLLSVLPSNTKKTNPLADYFDDFNETGPNEDMIYSLAESSCQYIEDLYMFFEKDELHKINTGLNEQLGYDGVVVPFNDGTVHVVAWFPEQVIPLEFDYFDSKEDDWSYIAVNYEAMQIAFRISKKELEQNDEMPIQMLSDFLGKDPRFYNNSHIYSDSKSFLKSNPNITVNDLKDINAGRMINKAISDEPAMII